MVRPTSRADIRIDSKTKICTEGIIVSIIDFSLAAFTSDSGERVYRNLDTDSWLFQGYSSTLGQYEIYRKMAQICHPGRWHQYHPVTNILWLQYVLESLLKRLPAHRAKGSTFERLKSISLAMLKSCSANELVRSIKSGI